MTKSFSDMKPTNEACWSGYKQVGFKKKNGRNVPNCVKEELVDLVLGKDYVFEGVEDMYKGKLNQAQINTIKNTWQHKKTLLPQDKERVKSFLANMDQFTKMALKQANIKHVSAMIEENELDFSEPLCDLLEDLEFKAAVRGQELKEFTDDQMNRLAKSYADLAGKTMSVQNANKLRKLFDRIPDSSLDRLRRKKIPFISGLALSRMIKKGMPVKESAWEEYVDFEGVEPIQEADLKERVPRKGDSFVNYRNKGDMSQLTRQMHFATSKEADAFKKKVKAMGGKVVHSGVIQNEADLSKSQIKKVHKMADELPKKDFIKRYGKDGDSVRYATATNMIKKKMGIGESKFKLNKGELQMSESYKQRFDSAMGHLGISSLGELNPEDQKPFFAFVDDLKEGLSAAQKKLPPALQKAIAKKMSDKKEDLVGGQKKLDKDKDGDLDAKDFAMLRKSKGTDGKLKEYGNMMAMKKMKKEDALGQEPMKKMKAPMPKEPDTSTMKDAPKAKEGMKAVVKTKQVTENKRYLQTKPGSLEEAVLKTRGLVK